MIPPVRARLDTLELRIENVERDQREMMMKQEDILKKQDVLLLKFARYEGGWGVLLMAGTALWSAVLLFRDKIVEKISG